jgi:hypothetical protein
MEHGCWGRHWERSASWLRVRWFRQVLEHFKKRRKSWQEIEKDYGEKRRF